MKSLIFILAIISTTRAITFNCTFRMWSITNLQSTYTCYFPTLLNINVSESLTAVYGQHQSGKTNDDVKFLRILDVPQLTYFPRAVENFFRNIEAISFWNTNISTLTGDELDPFPNLFWLRFAMTPSFERIPGNLFNSTPRMKHIDFNGNNIKHVGEDAFSNLTNLIYLDFERNYCVNRWADNNATVVQLLIEFVKTNCTDIVTTTTTTTPTPTTTTTTASTTTPTTTTTTPTPTTTTTTTASTTTPTTTTTTPTTTTFEDSTTTTSEDSTSTTPKTTTTSEDQTTTITSEETSTESSTTSDHEKIIITCLEKLSKALNTNFEPQSSCEVPASPTPFKISLGESRTRVEISLESVVDEDMLLIYFPSSFDPFHEHFNDESLSCVEIDFSSLPIIINDLTPSVPYLFCVLYSDPQVISPYQCQSFMVEKGTPWILQEDQMLVIYSVVGASFMAFFIGVAIAYLIVFQFPTLLRGSLKVIIVQDLNREERKQPDVPDPPIYLTPLPRVPRKQQPIIRCTTHPPYRKHHASTSDYHYPNRLSYDFTYDDDYARGYIIPLDPFGTSVEAPKDSDHSIAPAKPPRHNQLNYRQESLV